MAGAWSEDSDSRPVTHATRLAVLATGTPCTLSYGCRRAVAASHSGSTTRLFGDSTCETLHPSVDGNAIVCDGSGGRSMCDCHVRITRHRVRELSGRGIGLHGAGNLLWRTEGFRKSHFAPEFAPPPPFPFIFIYFVNLFVCACFSSPRESAVSVPDELCAALLGGMTQRSSSARAEADWAIWPRSLSLIGSVAFMRPAGSPMGDKSAASHCEARAMSSRGRVEEDSVYAYIYERASG